MFDNNYKSQNFNIPFTYIHQKVNESELQKHDRIFTHSHYHNELEIILFESGCGEFYIDGFLYNVIPGNIIVINPYQLHYGTTNNCNHIYYYCIDFDLSMLAGNKEFIKLQPFLCGEGKFQNFYEYSEDLEFVIKQLCSITCEKENYEFFITGYLYTLIGTIITEKAPFVISTHTDNVFVKKTYEYIENNFDKNITSKDAAVYTKYNHSYFCRMFRKNFNDNFGHFVNLFRIKKAKQLMKNPHKKITDIASACGYNNISYFSQVFRSLTGVTPTDYLSMLFDS